MTPAEFRRNARKHFLILSGIFGVANILMHWFRPFGLGLMEAFYFTIMWAFFHWRFTVSQSNFEGYGVADEINHLAQRRILPQHGELVGKVALRSQLREWKVALFVVFVTGGVSSILLFLILSDPWNISLFRLFLLMAVAEFFALLTQFYWWVAVNGYKMWRISRQSLRFRLLFFKVSVTEVEEIIAKAFHQDLAWDPPGHHP